MDKNKISSLPLKPGVYIFKNSAGDILYIGKAKSLKPRVSSYFSGSKKDVKTGILASQVADLDFIVTKNELEAFLLENSLIKEHKPRYNIMLKDDKSYPYIMITEGSKYPGVYVTRSLKDKKAVYYGPYYALEAKRVVQAIYAVFKARQCSFEFDKKPMKRPCIYYDTGVCSAPCVRFVSEKAYAETVASVKKFLRGSYKGVLSELEARMKDYSGKKHYEKAAETRDAIAAVRQIMTEQKVVMADEKDIDVINYLSYPGEIYMCVMNIRGGRLLSKKIEAFGTAGTDTESALEDYIYQYYSRGVYEPEELILPDAARASGIIGQIFEKKRTKPVFRKKDKLLLMAEENIREKIKTLERERASKEKTEKGFEKAAIELKDKLGLAVPPAVIDCIDVSHTHGSDTVAAAVVFRNGLPDKGNYRHYKIKTVHKIDDYDSVRETVKRRYGKMLAEDSKLPDIILIDGGQGQVAAAAEALGLVGVEAPVAGLAKREETLFLNGRAEPVSISNEAKFFLMAARDEAHRFANSYRLKLAGARTLKSVFDGIPFIGKRTKQMIYAEFRDAQSLVDAIKAGEERVSFLNKKQKDAILNKFIRE